MMTLRTDCMKFSAVLIFVIVFIMTSCTPTTPSPIVQVEESPTATFIPTSTPIPVTPTGTPTPAPSATATVVPSPTQTPAPVLISPENVRALQLIREQDKDPLYAVIGNLSISPKEDRIAIAGEKTILIDLASKKPIPLGKASLDVDFSPDGERLVISWFEGGVEIWDLAKQQVILPLEVQQAPVKALAWSHTGDFIAGYQDTLLSIWDAQKGKLAYQFELPEKETGWFDAVKLDWSPSQNLLAIVGMDPLLRIFNGEQLLELAGYRNPVTHASWSPDGDFLATSSKDEPQVIAWRASNWNQISTAANHQYWVSNVEWSPDGNLILTADAAGTVFLRNPKNGAITEYFPHAASPNSVHWSPDGSKIICDGCEPTLWVYDVSQERQIAAPSSLMHQVDVHYLPLKHTNRMLLYSQSRVQLWDLDQNEVQKIVDPAYGVIDALRFSPGGEYLAVTDGGYLSIVDGTTGERLRVIDTQAPNIFDFAWSPDQKSIAILTAADFKVKIWDIDSGEILQTISDPGFLPQLSWSKDNELVTGDLGGIIRIWDAVSGKQGASSKLPQEGIRDLQFSPDGKLLAGVVDGKVYIRNEENNKIIQQMDLPADYFPSAASWSPDGSKLAVALILFTNAEELPYQLVIMDVTTGESLLSYETISSAKTSWSISWSADSSLVALDNGEIVDATTGKQIGRLENVSQTIWSPDGKYVIAGANGLEYWGVLPSNDIQ
jgi:WD40 repeat protein